MHTEAETKEIFLRNTKDHKLKVIKNDGVYRHLEMRNANGSGDYCWQIITWPGHLAIAGDIGDYTFSHTEDMFYFFRQDKDKFRINTHYWAEKCRSQSLFGGGIRKFDHDHFIARTQEWFDEWKEDCAEIIKPEYLEDMLRALKTMQECDSNEVRAYDAVQASDDAFSEIGIFQDFWDDSCMTYTLNLQLCLYAIVATIQAFDKENSTCTP